MRAALYARVSTTERAELQDPETQLVQLRDYARFKRWTITKEYIERASGADDNRAVLAQLLNDAERGRFDAVLIWNIDRLSRRATNLLQIMERLKALNVVLVSTSEGLDTSNPYSGVVLQILGVLAGHERERTIERVKIGMDRAKRYGTKSGRAIGRPKRNVPRKRIIELMDAEPGISQREISRRLNIPRSTLQQHLREIEGAAKKPRGAKVINKPNKNGAAGNEIVSGQGGGP